MKLNRLDVSILRAIRDDYPLAHDPEDKSVVVIGERPVPTEDCVVQRFPKVDPAVVKQSLSRLLMYQCVTQVYLFSSSEVAEQWCAGKRLRLTLAAPRAGQDCFQVTRNGETVLDKCLVERGKRAVSKWISKTLEDYVPWLVMFGIGMLISSIFGFDIKNLWK